MLIGNILLTLLVTSTFGICNHKTVKPKSSQLIPCVVQLIDIQLMRFPIFNHSENNLRLVRTKGQKWGIVGPKMSFMTEQSGGHLNFRELCKPLLAEVQTQSFTILHTNV